MYSVLHRNWSISFINEEYYQCNILYCVNCSFHFVTKIPIKQCSTNTAFSHDSSLIDYGWMIHDQQAHSSHSFRFYAPQTRQSQGFLNMCAQHRDLFIDRPEQNMFAFVVWTLHDNTPRHEVWKLQRCICLHTDHERGYLEIFRQNLEEYPQKTPTQFDAAPLPFRFAAWLSTSSSPPTNAGVLRQPGEQTSKGDKKKEVCPLLPFFLRLFAGVSVEINDGIKTCQSRYRIQEASCRERLRQAEGVM